MTPSGLLNQINELIAFLLENGLAIDSNSAIIREVGHNSILTWANAPRNFFDTLARRFATVVEYRNFIQNKRYHCMLFDGSIIQFGYIFNNNDLIKHRNCYYPCPLIIDSSDIESIQPGDDFVALFDLLLDQEIGALRSGISISDFSSLQHASRLSTPIRFDFDSEAQTASHPASHLHIIDEDCRWPVFGPIGVGHFIRFIFHHFYPKLWSEFPILKNWELEFLPRSITQQEQGDLFIECQDFSQHE